MTPNVIHRRYRARQDLVEIFRLLARAAGLRVARRFSAEAEATFTRLVSLPGLGTRTEYEHPDLADLRVFPVSRYRNYLVFYRPAPDGIEIVRVLHGARDIDRILAEEFGVDEDVEEQADESSGTTGAKAP
jgi:toxin ParE1/3/4